MTSANATTGSGNIQPRNGEITAEKLIAGDTIAYYTRMFVSGDPRGYREARVLKVDPTQEDFPLSISSEELLVRTTFIQRIANKDGDKVLPPDGKWRRINTMDMIPGQFKAKTRSDIVKDYTIEVKNSIENMLWCGSKSAYCNGSKDKTLSKKIISVKKKSRKKISIPLDPMQNGISSFFRKDSEVPAIDTLGDEKAETSPTGQVSSEEIVGGNGMNEDERNRLHILIGDSSSGLSDFESISYEDKLNKKEYSSEGSDSENVLGKTRVQKQESFISKSIAPNFLGLQHVDDQTPSNKENYMFSDSDDNLHLNSHDSTSDKHTNMEMSSQKELLKKKKNKKKRKESKINAFSSNTKFSSKHTIFSSSDEEGDPFCRTNDILSKFSNNINQNKIFSGISKNNPSRSVTVSSISDDSSEDEEPNFVSTRKSRQCHVDLLKTDIINVDIDDNRLKVTRPPNQPPEMPKITSTTTKKSISFSSFGMSKFNDIQKKKKNYPQVVDSLKQSGIGKWYSSKRSEEIQSKKFNMPFKDPTKKQ